MLHFMEMYHGERMFSIAVNGKGRYFSQPQKRKALNASFPEENLLRSWIGKQFRAKISTSLAYLR